MHFHADDSSVKMMMNLIRSANLICIVFGMCGCIGKIGETDLGKSKTYGFEFYQIGYVVYPKKSQILTVVGFFILFSFF